STEDDPPLSESPVGTNRPNPARLPVDAALEDEPSAVKYAATSPDVSTDLEASVKREKSVGIIPEEDTSLDASPRGEKTEGRAPDVDPTLEPLPSTEKLTKIELVVPYSSSPPPSSIPFGKPNACT